MGYEWDIPFYSIIRGLNKNKKSHPLPPPLSIRGNKEKSEVRMGVMGGVYKG